MESSPNHHFGSGPYRSMLISSIKPDDGRCIGPNIPNWIVTPAVIQIDGTAGRIRPTPNYHLAASPNRRVLVASDGCSIQAHRSPTVSFRIVAPATVQIAVIVRIATY